MARHHISSAESKSLEEEARQAKCSHSCGLREQDGAEARPLSLGEVQNILTKNYLPHLTEASVVPYTNEYPADRKRGIRWYRVDKVVYEQGTLFIDKFSMIITALHGEARELILVLQKDRSSGLQFFLGVSDLSNDNNFYGGEILNSSLHGIFPGVVLTQQIPAVIDPKRERSLSVVSAVGSLRDERKEHFVQGLERLINATQDIPEFTAMIIAEQVSEDERLRLLNGYEISYSVLSPMASVQHSYSQERSVSATEGESESLSQTLTEGVSSTITHGTNTSTTQTKTVGTSKTTTHTVGGYVGFMSPVGIGGGGSYSYSHSNGTNESTATGTSYGTSLSKSEGENSSESHGTTISTNRGMSLTEGQSESYTITQQNKRIQHLLQQIEQQVERLDKYGPLGLWNCATYFIAPTKTTSRNLANIYRGCVLGEEVSMEVSAINTWTNDKQEFESIMTYLQHSVHPRFVLPDTGNNVSAGVIVNSRDLAVHLALPQSSVPGVRVEERATFGREVRSSGEKKSSEKSVPLGKVLHLGRLGEGVSLSLQDLTMHTFVTGSTGSGKSNTIYKLIEGLHQHGVKFLIIEPAKGEYKDALSSLDNVSVYSTNPRLAPLVKINPFSFPEGIHVQEHIDQLVEIFNACWPMYAAMPALLKMSIERAYIDVGWDLEQSNNPVKLFPTFADVLEALRTQIDCSDYAEESKANYRGALFTRIESLTKGITGMLFSGEELSAEQLFNTDVIVDLSRVRSTETKSLIMGLLTMKLSEWRMCENLGRNLPLRHVTILEEAHNLLRRTSTVQSSESANLMGLSVETIANSIAEMRTYGEGFVIVDQSPSTLDLSAIRNTNTKIVMTLPDKEDREIAGKAMGLSDKQVEEIARLARGEAIVYQSSWAEAIQCQVDKSGIEEGEYSYTPSEEDNKFDGLRYELLKVLLLPMLSKPLNVDLEVAEKAIRMLDCFRSVQKRDLIKMVENYRSDKEAFAAQYAPKMRQISTLIAVLIANKQRYMFTPNTPAEILDAGLQKYIAESLPANYSIEAIRSLSQAIIIDGIEQGECGQMLKDWCDYQKLKIGVID